MDPSQIDFRYLALLQATCPKAFRADATREDAGEALVIQRSLDHIEQSTTKVMYAEMRALRFIPLIGGIDPGAKTYTFIVQDKVGTAAVAAERGRDLPRVDVFLTEQTSGIKTYGASYGYTTQELRAIALASRNGLNVNLERMRADMCAEAIGRKIDRVVGFGDPDDVRIVGFLNHASVTTESSADLWANLSPEELYAELLVLANRQFIISKEVFKADTILLPTDQHQLVSTRQFGISGTETVLSFFNKAMQAAGRTVAVESWPLLAEANATLDGPRAVSYVRNVEVAGAIVPMAFQAQPAQPVGLEWVIPCEGICGGTAVKQPLGIYYRDGI